MSGYEVFLKKGGNPYQELNLGRLFKTFKEGEGFLNQGRFGQLP